MVWLLRVPQNYLVVNIVRTLGCEGQFAVAGSECLDREVSWGLATDIKYYNNKVKQDLLGWS